MSHRRTRQGSHRPQRLLSTTSARAAPVVGILWAEFASPHPPLQIESQARKNIENQSQKICLRTAFVGDDQGVVQE